MPISRTNSQELEDTGNIKSPYGIPDDGSSPSDTSCNTLSQPIYIKVNDSSTTINLDNKNAIVGELDCTQFTSSEIIVKVIGRDIIVEAEQKEQYEGESCPSSLYQTFYHVSDSHDLEKAKALLGLDKVLTLYAPRKDKKAVDEESPSGIEESEESLIKVEKEIKKEN